MRIFIVVLHDAKMHFFQMTIIDRSLAPRMTLKIIVHAIHNSSINTHFKIFTILKSDFRFQI